MRQDLRCLIKDCIFRTRSSRIGISIPLYHKLFYKILGTGIPIIFLHGGPGGYLDHDLPYFQSLKNA